MFVGYAFLQDRRGRIRHRRGDAEQDRDDNPHEFDRTRGRLPGASSLCGSPVGARLPRKQYSTRTGSLAISDRDRGESV
ncbi:hypothetical protein Ahu01nite_024980 [Winogradskya humida]|uniref:Uncharacterized protein n=1 Tax=Winogradskya humida TaxID=113566 RepID=A0ABQ3ZLC3_9ACTN|nr:hypothetical protein Ahu01nite_024980 [Actinoplanes humidus]